MLQAALVTKHKAKMKIISVIREFTTELQLYLFVWTTSMFFCDA